jgi:outer membrane protein assembly factor BamB
MMLGPGQRKAIALGIVALALVMWLGDEEGPAQGTRAGKGAREVPMFGGTPSRNLANPFEKGILDDFSVKKGKEKNLKWVAALGKHAAYGGPVIAGGRIFVGTNNESPRNPKIRGDRGIMMCFRESDGKFLWQAIHDKMDELNDSRQQGIASTPCVEGDRVYYVSNRAEVVCADVAGDGKGGAKVLWSYDMVKGLGVFVNQHVYTSPLILGDLVYCLTCNGTDVHTKELPNPRAPSLVALNKKTGRLAWSNALPGARVFHGQWSNPSAALVNGKWQVIYGGGDGWLYGLDAKSGELIWKFDCNPKKAKPYKHGGGGEKSMIIATPVIYENRCYVAVGQEPDDGPGVGHLWCIDFTKKPRGKDRDLSPVNDNFDPKAAVNKDSGLVWHRGGPILPRPKEGREYVFERTLSTVAIHDGLVYAAEMSGFLQCLDAKTGKKYWEYDFQESTWCSPYYVDGKVFIGTDSGDLYIFPASKTLGKVKKVPIGGQVKVPVVACNGVLYVNNGGYLYAIVKK